MKILTAAVATGAGTTAYVREADRRDTRYCRAVLAGTASVKLQGRFDDNDTWADIGTAFTATGFQSLQLMPQMRANVTAWTSGAVDVWIDGRNT